MTKDVFYPVTLARMITGLEDIEYDELIESAGTVVRLACRAIVRHEDAGKDVKTSE
jgi:hypothetical protein